jgi:hypothetical protein
LHNHPPQKTTPYAEPQFLLPLLASIALQTITPCYMPTTRSGDDEKRNSVRTPPPVF